MSFHHFLLALVGTLVAVSGRAQQPPGNAPDLPGAREFSIETIRVRSLLDLVGYSEVREELGVAPAVAEQVATLRTDRARQLTAASRKSIPKLAELRKLSREERTAKMSEMKASAETAVMKATEEFDSKLTEILTAEQLTRLTQIFVQVAPIDALAHTSVAKQLGLSEDQRKLTNDRRVEWNVAWEETHSEAYRGPDFVGGTAKVRGLNEAMLSKAADVLTAEQQNLFVELQNVRTFDKSRLAKK